MTDIPKRPESVPLQARCVCDRCRDRRVPIHLCVEWLTLTASLVMPADTPVFTFRFVCGDVRIITWSDIQQLRLRHGLRGAA